MNTAPSQIPDILCNLPYGAQQVCELGGTAVKKAADSAIDNLVDTLLDGLGTLLRFVLTWWIDLPSPQLEAQTGEPGPVLVTIRDYTSGLQMLLMTAGILVAATRLALAKRGGLAGEAQESFLMFGRAVLASMMFAAVVTVGTRAGDAFSDWVIFDASRGDTNTAAGRIAEFDLRVLPGLGTGVLLIIGLLGIVSMLVQLVMLVVRQALLVVVVAALPIAAAASGTGPGSQAYKKMLSWALAFVLWKPVGALIYAIAFAAVGAKQDAQQQDPQLVLLGLILLIMVAAVLPALMRLVAPAVATLGGGSGAAAALAGGALGLALGSAGSGADRSEARKMSEGEGSAGGGGPQSGPPPGPRSGGGGPGRPVDSGGGANGAAPTTGGKSATGSGSRGSAIGPGGATAAGTASTRGGAAAAAGPAGAAVAGAQLASSAAQRLGNAIGGETNDAASGTGWDPNAPGPREVRR
ncbi:hypothetical protein NDR87_14215 [Nocardia sp. CDC159]|uniref:TrbL/VirB6 plasmid conjugal transfer protein n=1 Tax=Nocardia pulmonis TaxID=2951408 RepID=A0A9X2E9Q3_9NOCA|nr:MULTISPECIES: hypothetical protein [Nocardia]MCM6774421.1 hypothetical protein [Nocardia pulmonis]MCM6787513.1 hypothetical protein [Nocardia sp. CDC159]